MKMESSITSKSTSACFPDTAWEEASPESEGIDSGVLRSALLELESVCGYDKLSQALLIRRGKLLWKGPFIDSVHNIWSCSKSFGSIVLGLLIDDGKCTLDTRLAEVIPELEELYPELTVGHVIRLTGGYTGKSRLHPFTPEKPIFAPGEYFHYDSDGLEMLALTLTILAGEPLDQLFRRRIADPINFTRWNWGDFGMVKGHRVNGISGTSFKGISTCAREVARIGWMLANNGSWKGEQLLSTEWIDQATRPQTTIELPAFAPDEWYQDIHGAYGYCFWANGPMASGNLRFPNLPTRMRLLQGNVNNFCFAIPEWELVFVRMGTDLIIGAEHYDRFFQRLKTGMDLD